MSIEIVHGETLPQLYEAVGGREILSVKEVMEARVKSAKVLALLNVRNWPCLDLESLGFWAPLQHFIPRRPQIEFEPVLCYN